MSCCEKQKYDRLKELQYAKILTCQSAGLLNRPMAVIKLVHDTYGPYYDGIPLDEAQAKGYTLNAKDEYKRIYSRFNPKDKLTSKWRKK